MNDSLTIQRLTLSNSQTDSDSHCTSLTLDFDWLWLWLISDYSELNWIALTSFAKKNEPFSWIEPNLSFSLTISWLLNIRRPCRHRLQFKVQSSTSSFQLEERRWVLPFQIQTSEIWLIDMMWYGMVWYGVWSMECGVHRNSDSEFRIQNYWIDFNFNFKLKVKRWIEPNRTSASASPSAGCWISTGFACSESNQIDKNWQLKKKTEPVRPVQFNSIQLPQQQQQRVQMQSSKFKARSSKVHSNSKSAVGSGQLNGSWQVFFFWRKLAGKCWLKLAFPPWGCGCKLQIKVWIAEAKKTQVISHS